MNDTEEKYVLPITLRTGEDMLLSAEDYGRMAGIPWKMINFSCGRRYVGFESRDTYLWATRYLVDAKETQIVRFQDGNPLNLTRSNLKIIESPNFRFSRHFLKNPENALEGFQEG